MPVVEAIASLPPSAFRRIIVSEGSQGPIVYEYAELTVWFSEESLPAEQSERLLVRRSLGQEPDLKYHRSNAPVEIPTKQVAAQRALRWTIEQDIQAGKGESGLDEYETRGWTGWHHHTALALLALLFLVLQRHRLGEKRAADERPRSPRTSQTPRRGSAMGRSGNHRVVELADGTKSNRKAISRSTTPRRTTATK
jgi:SRSO17 transposase